MAQSVYASRGMAVAPHAMAAQSAVSVLQEGGNAIEAMIAAAATIAVVYPHMNSIGGDGFWVIHAPGRAPGGIDASGRSAAKASRDWYAAQGVAQTLPFRGGLAALTVAATVSGWGSAHRLSQHHLNGRMPLTRLLEDAIYLAEQGTVVTRSQAQTTQTKLQELKDCPGFANTFLHQGAVPQAGTLFRQPQLARTLTQIARKGTDDFYRGALARQMAAELAQAGSPLTLADLQAHQAQWVDPLTTQVQGATLFNMQPPSQGLVSLLILALMDRMQGWQQGPESSAFIHAQVEATKLAFRVRDQYLTDRDFMKLPPAQLLEPARIDALVREYRPDQALPWGQRTDPGDTVWMGVIDRTGLAVSFIQSIYHEYGSGVVLQGSGVNWQNRGAGFSLQAQHVNTLEPRKKPFHTLNPAMAQLADGGTLVYGTMGGDGQPQTQATVFNRLMRFGDHPQQAMERPRWLLGRTWGQSSETLKLEQRFDPQVVQELRQRGHEVELLQAWDEAVGHAGLLRRHPHGVLEGGYDPRSNGAVVAY